MAEMLLQLCWWAADKPEVLFMKAIADFLLSVIPACYHFGLSANKLSRKRNLFCFQICNVIPMYSSIKCEMEEIGNVAETVLYDFSQDNCAFTAPQVTVMQPV